MSKGYHYDRLSSYRHRMLNLPETQHTTQSWRSVGPALFSQAGKKKSPIFTEVKNVVNEGCIAE